MTVEQLKDATEVPGVKTRDPERPMKVYTAGPMTGIPQFNFPAFDALAAALRELGFDVVSPAELDEESTREAALASPDGAPGSGSNNGETWGDFLARDVKLIADEVDGVVLMPGWEASKGARLEAFICRHVGKPVFYSIVAPKFSASSADDLHERVCFCGTDLGWPKGADALDWYQGVPFLELDDAELDNVFALADLEVLYKIARDEGRDSTLPRLARETGALAGAPAESVAQVIEEFEKGESFVALPAAGPLPGGEVRTVNDTTGAEKGSKLARFDLVPAAPLLALAEHYGRGSEKYDDRNWEKGLDWHLCFAAMMRHAWAWWGGEDIDEETGSNHMAAVAWHAFALLEFTNTHPELDNRPKENN